MTVASNTTPTTSHTKVATAAEATVTYKYSLALCQHLVEFNFDTTAPKHVLGFSSDFGLTWKRFRQYEEDVVYDEEVLIAEQQNWDNLSLLQKQACERNFALLKEQQQQLKAHQPTVQAMSSPMRIRSILQNPSSSPPTADGLPDKKRSRDEDTASDNESRPAAKRPKRSNLLNIDTAANQLAAWATGDVTIGAAKTREIKSDPLSADQLDIDELKPKRPPLWTPEEDQKLSQGVAEKLTFEAISEKYFADDSRTSVACQSRWSKRLKKAQQQDHRSDDEDDADEDDDSDFECRDAIKRQSWTSKEDDFLREGMKSNLSFKDISSQYFPDGNRPESACKKRWTNYLEKGKGESKSSGLPWSPEEDQKVLAGKLKHGLNFHQIADKYFPDGSRTAKACEGQWHHRLKKKYGGERPEMNVESDEDVSGESRQNLPERRARIQNTEIDYLEADDDESSGSDGDDHGYSGDDCSDDDDDTIGDHTYQPSAPKTKRVWRKWTVEEDEVLIEAVIDGQQSYNEASSLFSNRSESGCRNRLDILQKSNEKVRKWWKENNAKTKHSPESSDEEETEWEKIQKVSRQARRDKVIALTSTKHVLSEAYGDWTPRENKILLKAANNDGVDFAVIAEKYFKNSRNARQCHIQYEELKKLHPDGVATARAWTTEEDGTVRCMFKKGFGWSRIAAAIPCCTTQDVRDRYSNILEFDPSENEEEVPDTEAFVDGEKNKDNLKGDGDSEIPDAPVLSKVFRSKLFQRANSQENFNPMPRQVVLSMRRNSNASHSNNVSGNILDTSSSPSAQVGSKA
ncbi:MAG: hypothetical protein SGARI_000150 [Bacillariaceae sp.]